MSETAQDVILQAGERRMLAFAIADEQGQPLDISAIAFTWRCARRDGAMAVIEKVSGAGITVVDALQGRVDVQLDSADTQGLDGLYRHELWGAEGGAPFLLASGFLVAEPALAEAGI